MLFAIFLCGGSFSAMKYTSRNVSFARKILNSWISEAEEQRARLLLPKDVEVSYTTVTILLYKTCLMFVNMVQRN